MAASLEDRIMEMGETQTIHPRGIIDRVCQRCGEEPVTHRVAVTPLDPTTEREDHGLTAFVMWRIGDRCIANLLENWVFGR